MSAGQSFFSLEFRVTFVTFVASVTIVIVMSYGSLRLGKATIESLKDLHLAFEVAYLKPLSNDLFIQRLIDTVKQGDPTVWKAYQEILSKRKDNTED